jgi:hypothetical protein
MRYPVLTRNCCLAAVMSIWVSAACAQNASRISDLEGKIDRLNSAIHRLDHRIDQADEVARRLLAYGTVDEQNFAKFIRAPISDSPGNTVKAIEFNNDRPGIFDFTFHPKLNSQPVILLTSLGKWGDIPVKYAVSQVLEVSQNGFRVSISNQNGYVNCAFSIFIFGGDDLN